MGTQDISVDVCMDMHTQSTHRQTTELQCCSSRNAMYMDIQGEANTLLSLVLVCACLYVFAFLFWVPFIVAIAWLNGSHAGKVRTPDT